MASINSSELSAIIKQVLISLDIPVSVTLINTTLLSFFHMPPISEKFLIENNDDFALKVIGCDLKVFLTTVEKQKLSSNKAKDICRIIERDLLKLDEIKKSLQNDNKSEIQYDDFKRKFSSRKKKINEPFVVRNSHNLEIFCRDGRTYVRIVDDDTASIKMKNKEIIKILEKEGFKKILAFCLKNLLSNFTHPLNLGCLQASFSLGEISIDNCFLQNHHKILKCTVIDSVSWIGLNPDRPKEEIDEIRIRLNDMFLSDESSRLQELTLSYPTENTDPKPEEVASSVISENLKRLNNFKNDLKDCAQKAIESNKSLIIVGEDELAPHIFDLLPNDNSYRLSALKNIRKLLDEEIERLKN